MLANIAVINTSRSFRRFLRSPDIMIKNTEGVQKEKNFINWADISFWTRILLLLDFYNFAVLNYYKCRENVIGNRRSIAEEWGRNKFQNQRESTSSTETTGSCWQEFPIKWYKRISVRLFVLNSRSRGTCPPSRIPPWLEYYSELILTPPIQINGLCSYTGMEMCLERGYLNHFLFKSSFHLQDFYIHWS